MGVTIKEIAAATGVSRGTVDRVLNGRSGVKPETAERIKAAAKQLGYTPSLAAKMLSSYRYGKIKIGILLVTENNSFFDEVILGAKNAVAEFSNFGVTCSFKIMDNYDTSLQLKLLEELENEGCHGIAMTPVSSELIVDKINSLNEKGIKTVTINTDVTGSKRLAYVGCHHQKSGQVMAGLLNMLSNQCPMNIGLITAEEKNLAVYRRTQGFIEQIESQYPNIHIVCTANNESNDEQSYKITSKMIESIPHLDAICVMGAGIIGSINAVKNARREHTAVHLLVYDLIDEVREAIIDGVVDATIMQEPYRQGNDGVQLLVKYLAFNQLPKDEMTYTKLSIITKECL